MAKNGNKQTELAKPETSMVLASAGFSIVQSSIDEIKEAILSNFEEDGLSPSDLEQIRIPTAGGKMWVVPDLEEGEKSVKTLSAVILGYRVHRAYWRQSFDESGGGSPPDCSSQDSKIGYGDPGGECAGCPFNKWESASKGGGKACQEFNSLFLLSKGSSLPQRLTLPCTSLKGFRVYRVRLSGNMLKFHHVITDIGLAESTSKAGIKYSVATFAAARDKDRPLILDSASRAFVDEYSKSFMAALESKPIDVEQREAEYPSDSSY